MRPVKSVRNDKVWSHLRPNTVNSLYFPESAMRLRSGAEIATANLVDIDPGVDREHFSLVLQGGLRHQLSPTEWQLFTALYQRHGRIVPPAELATATRNAQRKIRAQIPRLRRSLIRSRFLLRTHHALGYELIVRVEEHSAHVA
jgi:DNA-binding response OmpR family regulator